MNETRLSASAAGAGYGPATPLPAIDSVLFVGFGGPTEPSQIMPFLRHVTRGRGVPDERLVEVEHHYMEVGGRSPYNALTERQRAGVERWLADRGRALPIYCGMRNWDPFLKDEMARMARDGRRHAAGVILAAHRSEVSWERYALDVAEAVKANRGDGPIVSYVNAYYGHPRFLEANAQRIEEVSGYRRGRWPQGVPIVFTAHSIPVALSRGSPYEADLWITAQGVARLLGAPDWEIAWQSRSGDPRTPWLEPDVNDVLRRRAGMGAREVVVQAIGFLSDHVEVLFDLDIEARETATELGLRYHRAGCVNDHPEFVALLGEEVLATCDRFA